MASALVKGIGATSATTAGTPGAPCRVAMSSESTCPRASFFDRTHGEKIERALCAPRHYPQISAQQLGVSYEPSALRLSKYDK